MECLMCCYEHMSLSSAWYGGLSECVEGITTLTRNLFLEFAAGLSQIETVPSSQLAFFSSRVRHP